MAPESSVSAGRGAGSPSHPGSPMTPARVAELGVVGAGGGGFPTAVKLATRVPLVIANAAECEPLLHKDKELLHHLSEPFLRGMLQVMEMVGAPQGVIGIKEKYHDIIAALEQSAPANIRVAPLPDAYPAGDEFILVHIVTGRVIPPGGLPKDVDAMVANVETLMNIGLDQPVTHKYLTVAGAVRTPVTLRVPVGISIGEVIEAAGGATVDDFSVLLGGVMMAKPAAGLDVPVTKTTGGIVVLPHAHSLIQRHTAKWPQIARVGRSACDQCRFCTEFCPRYLLGHPIQPHRAMRSLGFATSPDGDHCRDALLLRVQPLLAVRVSRRPGSEERLRPVQARGARPTSFLHGDARFRRSESHGRVPPGADEAPDRASWVCLISTTSARWSITILTRAAFRLPLKQHAGVPAVPVVKTRRPRASGRRAGSCRKKANSARASMPALPAWRASPHVRW